MKTLFKGIIVGICIAVVCGGLYIKLKDKISFHPKAAAKKVVYTLKNVLKNQTTVTFNQSMEVYDGKTFGKDGQFTFELHRNGTFLIDKQAQYAQQRSDSYLDSAFIRSTHPLPKTYKISVVLGEIDYGLDNIAGLSNDPKYPEGPLNENGFYMIAITDVKPEVPHTNIWWHQHRKVVIDVDNNVWGHGMPNPVFMVYFDQENKLNAFNGKTNRWESGWNSAINYDSDAYYRVELEKTKKEFIFRILTDTNKLLKEARAPLDKIYHEDQWHEDYFVIGEPHENYYQGSMKIKEITVRY